MDTDSWICILIVVFFIFAAYFACAESAFAGLNKIRIKNMAESGDRRAKRSLYIVNHFDKMLTSVLVGSNVAHIGASALITILVTRRFGAQWLSLATILTTLVVFFFCEMIPKSFAKANSEKAALALSGSLRSLMKILSPVAFLFNLVSELISRVFGSNNDPTITEDELYDIIENIDEEGLFEAEKQELVQSALEFSEITAQEILTPRVDVVAVDIRSGTNEVLDIMHRYKYSRFPVYDGTIDNIVGILHVRSYLSSIIRGQTQSVAESMTEVYTVRKTTDIDDMLDEMSTKKLHMAVVTDEFGGTMGIVTLEDILEELVGEIWDESDEVIEEFKKIGGERYLVDGEYSVGDAFDEIGVDFDDEEYKHRPISSWALSMLTDKVPQEGDGFEYEGFTIEIESVHNNRIVEVLIKRIIDDEEEIQPVGESRVGVK